MREMLSEDKETRAWVGIANNIGSDDDVSSHFGVGTGQFQRSFRSFLYGGGEQMRVSPQQGGISQGGRFASSSPRPWEAGHDGLRLPRYMTVMSASSSLHRGSINTPLRSGMILVNSVNNMHDQFSSHNEEEEEEEALSVDVCGVTGSV